MWRWRRTKTDVEADGGVETAQLAANGAARQRIHFDSELDFVEMAAL